MNIEQMTQKTREALQAAQRIAVEYSNNAVEQEHLLAALAQQPGGTQTAQDTAGLTAQLPVAAAARAMNWNGKEVK